MDAKEDVHHSALSEPTFSDGDSIPEYSPPPAILTNLPPEIHLEIFSHLLPVASACLGLTCRKFYSIHRASWGRIPLRCYQPHVTGTNCLRNLHHYLENWMWESARLVYAGEFGGLFVTEARMEWYREQRRLALEAMREEERRKKQMKKPGSVVCLKNSPGSMGDL